MEKQRKVLEVGDTVRYVKQMHTIYDETTKITMVGVVKAITVTGKHVLMQDNTVVTREDIVSIIQTPSQLQKLSNAYEQQGITTVSRPNNVQPHELDEIFAELHKMNVGNAINHALDVGNVEHFNILTGGHA